MPVFQILSGLVLLVSGRKLFWLFVGCLGLVSGFALATRFFGGQSDLIVLAVAVLAGILGAMLAIFVQKLAIGIAGFLGGGYIALAVATPFGPEPLVSLIAYLAGGLLGTLMMAIFFEWALILLSSVIGAAFIVEYIPLEKAFTLAVFLILTIAGTIMQSKQMAREAT